MLRCRHTQEVAAFEEEQSVAGEASEASPWAYLQKTYSNVEESGHSTSSHNLQGRSKQGSQTDLPHQEIIIVDGAADNVQVWAAHST